MMKSINDNCFFKKFMKLRNSVELINCLLIKLYFLLVLFIRVTSKCVLIKDSECTKSEAVFCTAA